MLVGKINNYQIIETLGKGSFGVVYLVQDPNKTNYALKSIDDTDQNIQLAKRQAMIYSTIKHPNITKLHEFFPYNDGKCLAIVLEYCPDGDLADLMKKRKLTKQQRENIIRMLASALAYLHDMKIVHRDIKPQNIVMSKDNPKMADFGSSKVLNTQRANTMREGSLYYMAPEMLEYDNYDNKVDVWSFGVLCYELLVGKRIMQVLDSRKPPALREDFPSEGFLKEIEDEKFRELVRKMLTKDSKQRLASKQVLDILEGKNLTKSQIKHTSSFDLPMLQIIRAQSEHPTYESQQKKSQHKFSPNQKGKSITLQNDNLRATNPSLKLTDELALVEGTATSKGSSIWFKVQTIGCGVAVGMTMKNLADFNSYQPGFSWQLEHGCFILTHSGFSYSHSNKDENKVKTQFKYDQGDVIKVETKNDTLLFVNETKKKQHTMQLKMTEKDWKQACFCVYLCGRDDSLAIL